MGQLDNLFQNKRTVKIRANVYYDVPTSNDLIYSKDVLRPELEDIKKFDRFIFIDRREIFGKLSRNITPQTEIIGKAVGFSENEEQKLIEIECKFLDDGITEFLEKHSHEFKIVLVGVGKYNEKNKNVLDKFKLNKLFIIPSDNGAK